MDQELTERVKEILKEYSHKAPAETAMALRALWQEFEPNRGIELVKLEQRSQYEAVGTPVPVLKTIATEIARPARKDVEGFLPLARLLWDDYGREGRVVALIVFGALELTDPLRMVPLIKELSKQCVSWEDADRLAMDALEPIVRKAPDKWLGELVTWLQDENKWVRRAAVTIIGRLPMKHPAYVRQCLEYAGRLLEDKETDVKRAVSFVIRLCAKTDPQWVCEFLKRQVPPVDPEATWVLCDVIKSMGKKQLPEFSPLLGLFQAWSREPGMSNKDKRMIESAIKVLKDI